jgi:uncharacterized RDD family membrane protein YckC
MHRYATLPQRLCALIVDGLVFAAFWFPMTALALSSGRGWLAIHIFVVCVGMSYDILMHAKFGQTVGKMVLAIQLRTVEGAVVNWKHALKRASVDIVLGATNLGVVVWAASNSAIRVTPDMTVAEFWSSIGALSGASLVRKIGSVWSWSEIATMVLRTDRRALHDLLGGTVVVQVSK